ncbi:MAG: PilN domain-containing protein [Nitrospirota bacterium]
MIRVNLLTEKRKKKKAAGPAGFLVLVSGITLVTLIVVGGTTIFLKSKVSHMKEQRETNRVTINDLSKRINEIKKYERLNKELEQKSNLIETLRKNQSVPVKLLDEVSSLIPEGVWLSSFLYRDNGVSLEGIAFTNNDIVAYVDNLKKSPSFADVYLEESSETEVEKVKVYRFKLNFKIKV